MEADMAPEALKEIVATSSVDQSGSLNVEFPSLLTETVDGEKAVRLPDHEDESGVKGCLESETKHSYCPDSGKFAEPDCEISSSEINFLTEIFASDLEPEVTSMMNMQFPDVDHFGHDSSVGQAHSQEPPFSGADRDVVEGRLYHPLSKANSSGERNLTSFLEVNDASNGKKVHQHSSHECSITMDDGVPAGRHTHEQPGSIVTPKHIGSFAPMVEGSAPLQSCPPSVDVQRGSYLNQVKLEPATNSSGPICGNNSVAVADFSCHADEERKGSGVMAGFVGEYNDALSSVQSGPPSKKHVRKESKRTYTRKGAEKDQCKTIDLLPPVVRSRRSCLSRTPCALQWGSADILSGHINQSCEDLEAGFIGDNGKDMKQKKAQINTSSKGYKGANLASPGHIRFKVKLGKQSNSIALRGHHVGTDSVADVSRNCIKIPNSVVNLEKLGTSQERTEVSVQHLDNDIETALSSGKSSVLVGSDNSDKEVEKSEISTNRHMNSGTSPDSEIVQTQDSLFASKASGLCHIREVDPCKTPLVDDDNTCPATTKTRGKVNMDKRHLSFGDFDISDRLDQAILSQSTVSKAYPRNDAKSNAASSMARVLGPGHKSAESWKSIEFSPADEAPEIKKSKGSKTKGATKSKKKPMNAQLSDMDSSQKGKGDKWRLASKFSTSEIGTSDDQIHEMRGCLEAGNSMMSKTNAIISDGNGQQMMRSQTAWVCCDDCSKWRCIPAELADIIGETSCRWTCKDNEDKAFAGCSIPQEKSNAEINAELNISGDEDGQGANSDAKCNNMTHAAASLQSSWMLIKSNIFLHRSRKTQSLDEMMICHCKPPRDGKSGCGDECLNRMLSIECAQETCPCGQFCSNQQFQKRNYADLQWFRCGKKGYGLQVLEDVSEGQFIIEYVGEVLDFSTYEARQREYASKGHKHFYFMTLNGNEVIDACAKGNLGRFINHSCDPNCRTEKWMVNGEICIGFFAVRDIKKGEELTFDYNYVRVFGAAAKKCHCGSPHCRGYIGGDPLNSELIVQGDSDEEFPEPVVIYENGDLSDRLGARHKPSFPDVVGKQNGDNLPRQAANFLPGNEEIINKVEETSTSLQGGSLFTEKDEVYHSVAECSQVQRSLETSVDPIMEIGGKISNDFLEKKSTSDRIGTTFLSPKVSDSSSMERWRPEPFSVCFDATSGKLKNEMSGNKPISGARPRMKICRASGSVNGKESCISRKIVNKDSVINSTTNNESMINRSPSGSSKPSILVESSAKHLLEGVEQKLNELLDSVGGICKRKDAFKGYLKLLYQTAASGDGSHREIIQSNKDLSMILDAILKTKSRRVLTDIINKNGLQMLHLMMKKCRGNFSMIPILRKLLKVFEFLAERKILTVEDINGDSHRPGVESFRDSVLTLTEHQDRKVHQIARNFRDSWIRKPVKKYNRNEKFDQKMELNRAPNCSSFPAYMKHSPSPSHMIDAKMPESASPHAVECKTNMRTSLKRKSGWDQPFPLVSPHCTVGQGLKLSSRADDERQEMEEDAPPGFSSPLNVPLRCPSKVPLGHVQQNFNSQLPVAYGIPLKVVLEFGTPQAATADGWVIAPGGPFHPFPPPPPHPRKGAN